MATRLGLRFRGQQSALLLRTLVFLGLLGFARLEEFNWFSLLLFFGGAVACYAVPIANAGRYVAAATVTAVLAALFVAKLSGFAVPGAIIGFAAAFYVILGCKNRYFVYRGRWHYFLLFGISYLAFLAFFISDRSSAFTVKLLAVAALSFFLWREFFRGSALGRGEGDASAPRVPDLSNLAAGVIAIVVAEAAWAASLLPLDATGAVHMTALTLLIASEAITRSFDERFSPRAILSGITLVVFLTIAIFGIAAFGSR